MSEPGADKGKEGETRSRGWRSRRLTQWRMGGLLGTSPGTLMADPEAQAPIIRVLEYGPDGITETEVTNLEQVPGLCSRRAVTWINIDGLGDADVVSRLGDMFAIHRLAQEDALNVPQRPKVEEYPHHVFIVCRMPLSDGSAESEQLSMFLGKDYVLTFQEVRSDCLEVIRERIRHGRGRIRKMGPDYLAYALLDTLIDAYFPALENLGEQIEALEASVFASPGPDTLARIHALKHDLRGVRRDVWPLRDMMNALIRDNSPMISNRTRVFLRDCYDHVVQLMDFIETMRELSSDLMDIYHSSVSARLNEIMKVLTLIATIFIPLSFIASVYGMNFDADVSPWNMPELKWFFGYPFALGLMAAVAGVLLGYFYKNGWIGGGRRR